MGTQKVEVTSAWGEAIGYSRAVRAGDLIFVSGTTASGPDGAMYPGDAGAQTTEILNRIVAALKELGAGPQHVVETRIYLADISTWQAVGKAHGALFKDIRPATVILEVSKLIAPDLLVEIAATASLAAG